MSRPLLLLVAASALTLVLARRRRLANARAASLPASLTSLRTPCAIVRQSIVERNTAAMLARAASQVGTRA